MENTKSGVTPVERAKWAPPAVRPRRAGRRALVATAARSHSRRFPLPARETVADRRTEEPRKCQAACIVHQVEENLSARNVTFTCDKNASPRRRYTRSGRKGRMPRRTTVTAKQRRQRRRLSDVKPVDQKENDRQRDADLFAVEREDKVGKGEPIVSRPGPPRGDGARTRSRAKRIPSRADRSRRA